MLKLRQEKQLNGRMNHRKRINLETKPRNVQVQTFDTNDENNDNSNDYNDQIEGAYNNVDSDDSDTGGGDAIDGSGKNLEQTSIFPYFFIIFDEFI